MGGAQTAPRSGYVILLVTAKGCCFGNISLGWSCSPHMCRIRDISWKESGTPQQHPWESFGEVWQWSWLVTPMGSYKHDSTLYISRTILYFMYLPIIKIVNIYCMKSRKPIYRLTNGQKQAIMYFMSIHTARI